MLRSSNNKFEMFNPALYHIFKWRHNFTTLFNAMNIFYKNSRISTNTDLMNRLFSGSDLFVNFHSK